METLVRALRGILSPVFELRGDENHASWACLLAHQLMEYRDRASRQAGSASQRKRKLSVGGVACAIMRIAGVEFSQYRADYSGANNIGFRSMDLRYMLISKMLIQGVDGGYLYEFIHPQQEETFVRLPRDEWTSLTGEDGARNAGFLPPLEDIQEAAGEEEPEPEAAEPMATEDEAAEPMTPEDRRGRTTSGRLEKRVNFIAKMQKGMMKTLNKLMRGRQQDRKKIAALEAENREIRARHSMSHPGGTSAPSARFSPTRYSFAGTEYYRGDEHYRGADEQDGQDDDPGSGDDQPQ